MAVRPRLTRWRGAGDRTRAALAHAHSSGPGGADLERAEPFDGAVEAEQAVAQALQDSRLHGGPIDLERSVDVEDLLVRLVATVRRVEARADEAERAALVDPLTALANRRAWRRALRAEEERYKRGGPPATVAVIDIDGFKEINDTHGHAAGDALLVRVAQTLLHSARAGDVVARTGGDEFAVLAVRTDAADRVVERLRAALDAAEVHCSLGAAARPPAGSLGDAWDDADRSMYADKARRRSRA